MDNSIPNTTQNITIKTINYHDYDEKDEHYSNTSCKKCLSTNILIKNSKQKIIAECLECRHRYIIYN